MQPIQPYSVSTPYVYTPVQNQIPQRKDTAQTQKIAITPPLSGLINIPNYTPPTIPYTPPKVVPPLAGLITPPVDYPKPPQAPTGGLAGAVMGTRIEEMFSTPSFIRLSDAELEPIQQDLYNKKQFDTLSKMNKTWNYSYLYGTVKDNKDFNELLNSKFYQGKEGFYDLLETSRTLYEQRKSELSKEQTFPPVTAPAIDYKKYDIPDYLRIINEFVKSPNYSDDLKEFYLKTKSKELDSFYGNLDSISKVVKPTDALVNKQF